MRWLAGFPLIFFVLTVARANPSSSNNSPSTEPSLHKVDLLGPEFVSRVHGIEFRPPADSVQADKPGSDLIAEFDRDDYDWQLKAWTVRLERSLPLTVHKDQFGNDQDGVMEVTLANIKQQTPSAEVVRNELINVGRIRVGMLAVRYETADHDRRYTQEAIFEAPNADHKLYYFLDLTGPGKPQFEPEDIVNPAEKMAHDTFEEVVDSVVLLDRSGIVEYQRQGLYSTMGLFVLWNADDNQMIRSAIVPDQYQRIIRDGQDVGYQHIVEQYEPNLKSPEESVLRVGIHSRTALSPLEQRDTVTWMVSSADRKHEHWDSAARRIDDKGNVIDTFSQLATSDEQTKAYVVNDASGNAANGSLLPSREGLQRNVDIATRRTLEVTTTHQQMQLTPFRMDVPVFYVPQAFSYLMPELLPLKSKTYMFATFVPSSPRDSGVTSGGNVMSRYMEVLPAQLVKFRGQEFDAIPVTDKITLEGPLTTYYLNPEGRFLGSTSTIADGDKTTTIEVVPTDATTLEHLWNHPDLSPPGESAVADNPAAPPQ